MNKGKKKKKISDDFLEMSLNEFLFVLLFAIYWKTRFLRITEVRDFFTKVGM